ncbi:MAG: AMP-dependent synthetase [Isosphaeraceae bacterium]|jgi:acetyl-CoA synthetase|nr:MAG: AMP-dependent synthetase [Isosphaeraceae bacterium]
MSEPYAWTPSSEQLERSNVARFMRRHDLPGRQELIERSIQEPCWFWDAVVRELGLVFTRPYHTVRDDSAGAPWTCWFVGGRLNLTESLVDRHLPASAERPALVAESEDGSVTSWTYAQLHEEMGCWTAALADLGVSRGDRVGLFLPLHAEAVAAFLAVARLGAVAVPIFSGFGGEAVAARLNDCQAVALVTADGVRRKGQIVPIKATADAALAHCPSVRHVVVVRRIRNEIPWVAGRDHDWDSLRQDAGSRPESIEMDAEDPFLIAYTSGTTGRPKGAVHVHGGFLVKVAQEAAFQTDLTAADRLYWMTDLGWIMGPWAVVGALAAGGTLVLYDGAAESPGPDRIWSLVERHGVTILGLSPTFVRAAMRHGEEPVRSHDLSGLRILASTGEPWNPGPWRWYLETVGGGRCPIINLSGGTEVGACFLSPLPITPLRPCTLGGPALGMAVDVVDPSGRSLRGAVGELVCRQPWPGMTRGLWNDPDRYLQTYWSRFDGLWTHGDWASIDEDGLWYLHGRSDDTLNVAGKRIGPAEIESVVVDHGAAAECAAIGMPHPVKGEAVWCFVVPRPGVVADETTGESIRQRVRDSLGRSFAPEEVRFVSELPRTRNAKILRRAIRARLLNLPLGDLSNLENPSSLEQFKTVAPPPSSDPQAAPG